LDGQTLAGIEAPELDARFIRILGHFTAQGVDFLYQVPFGKPADGRVAAHGRDVVQIDGQEKGGVAHARRSKGCFATCVAGTHNDHVICFIVGGHR
jgi:hypothetical protein